MMRTRGKTQVVTQVGLSFFASSLDDSETVPDKTGESKWFLAACQAEKKHSSSFYNINLNEPITELHALLCHGLQGLDMNTADLLLTLHL